MRGGVSGLLVGAALLASGCTFLFDVSHLTGAAADGGADSGGEASSAGSSGGSGSSSGNEDATSGSGSGGGADGSSSGGGKDASGGESGPPSNDGATDADSGIPYPSIVLADAPIAYWRLDDVGNSAAKDISGNGNNGAYTGGVTLGAPGAIVGDTDTAVKLDGTSGWVSGGDELAFTGQSPFTIEAWIQPTVIDAVYRGILSYEAAPATGKEGYVTYLQSSIGVGYDRYQTGMGTPMTALGAVSQTSSSWYHVVGTYDGSTMALWVNGAMVASSATTLVIQSVSCVFAIGATHCGTQGYLQGSVDEVAVYGTALSAARIKAHYHAGSGQ